MEVEEEKGRKLEGEEEGRGREGGGRVEGRRGPFEFKGRLLRARNDVNMRLIK